MKAFWTILLDALKNSLELTIFVALMMILIEVLDLESRGRIFKGMRHGGPLQTAVSTLLGSIPGCVGGYASTSLYGHGMLSYGALLAMMVATTGDEAFVMLAMFPKTALAIMGGLFLLGFIVGLAVDFVRGRIKRPHHHEAEHCHALDEDGEKGHRSLREFLRENVLHHVVLHHVPKIFAWTFGALLVLGVLEHYVDINEWIGGNTALMIVVAALVGLIPQSGPHLVFVTLFASGAIPLPVLLASCVSQDGHASLPLLADDRRTFLETKAATCLLGLAVGFIAYAIF